MQVVEDRDRPKRCFSFSFVSFCFVFGGPGSGFGGPGGGLLGSSKSSGKAITETIKKKATTRTTDNRKRNKQKKQNKQKQQNTGYVVLLPSD